MFVVIYNVEWSLVTREVTRLSENKKKSVCKE